MAALIEWDTVGAIFGESILAGVVIVGAFAYGARLVAAGGAQHDSGRPAMLNYALAALCFLVVAAGIAYGIYFTIDK
jgi:hypothetical protein